MSLKVFCVCPNPIVDIRTIRINIIFFIICIFQSVLMFANGHIYEMLGLRCASLSAVTKVGAGQKDSRKHLNPNILYMMLAFRCYFLIFMFLQISMFLHSDLDKCTSHSMLYYYQVSLLESHYH